MAKRRRMGTRVKRVYSRARGMFGGMGKMKNTLVGVGAGVGRQVGNKFLPGWGAPLAEFGIGWVTNNDTALYMSGRDAGGMVSSGALGGLLGGSTGGGNVI